MKFLPKPKPVTAIDSSISNGAELAGVVLVFFLIGLGLDVWLGTTPLFMLALTVFGTIHTYERLLARTRAERDEAIADADLATDLFSEAIKRHPSGQQYGGGNLRIVK